MERLIYNYIENPRSALANFELAEAYEKINHYAAASSYYLRCAEWGDPEQDKDMIYESLIHIGLLLGKLHDRTYTEEGWYMHAINFCPNRPEAYWCMSQVYERQGKWYESYTFATIGMEFPPYPMIVDIGFEPYMMVFQKAVAAWWIGRTAESREIFFSLPNYPLNEKYQQLVQNNLSSIGGGADPFVHFDPNKLPQLRFKFNGYENIQTTYGQVYQDLFTLCMLNGKKKGYYLEIGSAHPYIGSNTALLEKEFGWRGISIEYNEELVKEFRNNRANEVICKDATIINYDKLLRQSLAPMDIDYLQLDCEPPKTTYDILLAIPFERYRFAVITFEHDYYADVTRKYRDLSRAYLKEQGYVMVVNDIGRDERCSFEDWWVHPDLIDPDILSQMMDVTESVHLPEQYMFPNVETKKQLIQVNWITLHDSISRQKYMKQNLKKLGMKSEMVLAYDGRQTDYMNHPSAILQRFENLHEMLDSGGVATAMSHLKAIKNWYDTTSEPYGLFMEDDISFETLENWNFTWEELIGRLPKGFSAVQLSIIKSRQLTEEDMKFQIRHWDNWSAFAYIISRAYAKELIDKYIRKNEVYNLVLDDNLAPIPENVIFGAEREGVYTLPVMAENNRKFKSTFYPNFIETEFKPNQKDCSEFILKWWKEHKGNQLNVLFNS